MRVRTLFAVVVFTVSGAATAIGMVMHNYPVENNVSTPIPTFVGNRADFTNTPQEPYLFFLPNCEETESVPCVTWDENEWRAVFGYSPDYAYSPLHKCENEGGGKNLPCVYVSDNNKGIPAPYLVYSWDKDIVSDPITQPVTNN